MSEDLAVPRSSILYRLPMPIRRMVIFIFLGMVLFGIYKTVALVVAVGSGTVLDYWFAFLGIFFVTGIVGIVDVARSTRAKKLEQPLKRSRAGALTALLAMLTCVLSFLAWGYLTIHLGAAFVFDAVARGSILGTLTLTLLAGGFLFFWRLKLKSTYGLTEVVVGLALATEKYLDKVQAHGLALDWSSLDNGLAVLGGIYLVVRGFDNIHQGIVKEPRDPFAHAAWVRVAATLKWLGSGPDRMSGASHETRSPPSL